VEDMEFCFEKMAGPEEEHTIASRTLETELLDALLASGCNNTQDTKVAITNLKSGNVYDICTPLTHSSLQS
jgi:hypothetical protein